MLGRIEANQLGESRILGVDWDARVAEILQGGGREGERAGRGCDLHARTASGGGVGKVFPGGGATRPVPLKTAHRSPEMHNSLDSSRKPTPVTATRPPSTGFGSGGCWGNTAPSGGCMHGGEGSQQDRRRRNRPLSTGSGWGPSSGRQAGGPRGGTPGRCDLPPPSPSGPGPRHAGPCVNEPPLSTRRQPLGRRRPRPRSPTGAGAGAGGGGGAGVPTRRWTGAGVGGRGPRP